MAPLSCDWVSIMGCELKRKASVQCFFLLSIVKQDVCSDVRSSARQVSTQDTAFPESGPTLQQEPHEVKESLRVYCKRASFPWLYSKRHRSVRVPAD